MTRPVLDMTRLLSLIPIALLLSSCSMLNAGVPQPTTLAANSNHKALAFQAEPALANRLSGAERALLANAELQALDYGLPGQAVSWKAENATIIGSVRAFQLYRVGSNACRRFEHSVSIAQQADKISGTACRQQGNDWRLVQ